MDASGVRGQPQLSASGNERAEEGSNWCGKTIYQVMIPDVNNPFSYLSHRGASGLCWATATVVGLEFATGGALTGYQGGMIGASLTLSTMRTVDIIDLKMLIEGDEGDDCAKCSRVYCAPPAVLCMALENIAVCSKHIILRDKIYREAIEELPCTEKTSESKKMV